MSPLLIVTERLSAGHHQQTIMRLQVIRLPHITSTTVAEPHRVYYRFNVPADTSNFEMTGLPSRDLKLYVQAIDSAGLYSRIGDLVNFKPVANPLFPSIHLAQPTPTGAIAGESHDFQLVDSNIEPRTFQLMSGPANATIDTMTGMIHWDTDQSHVGSNLFKIRATNQYGYRDFSFSMNVYFSGPIQSLSYVRTGFLTASVSWTPPTDETNVRGYKIFQEWSINGHTYHKTYDVPSPTQTNLENIFVVGGPVLHRVSVAAYDQFGNLSVISPKVTLVG
ncbi:MAG: hypothetical protein R3C03_05245 [Pirellulaceae bacterium]